MGYRTGHLKGELRMGIYINMEMPKSCADCKLGKKYGLVGDYHCFLLDQYFTNNPKPPYKEKPDECPLIPVPPHGRLIDADALEVISYREIPQGCEDTFDSGVMWLLEQIDLLPTIIPAEEVDDEIH